MMVTTALPLATLLLLMAAAVVSAESQDASVTDVTTPLDNIVTETTSPYPIAVDTTSVKSGRCPDETELWREKCYFFSNGKGDDDLGLVTEARAADFCRRFLNGTLAMAKKTEDQIFLAFKLTESSWIGLSAKEEFGLSRKEKSWKWADNTLLTQPGFWWPLKSGADGNCVEMRRDWLYMWNDIPCNEKRHFVCEVDAKQFCPPGWIHHKEEGMCYYFPHEHEPYKSSKPYKRHHKDAEDMCKEIGIEPQGDKAHLVHVKTDSTKEFLKQRLADDYQIWIGLKKDGWRSPWKWSDGSPLKQSFWDIYEPSRDGLCVEARKLSDFNRRSWMWNDVDCETKTNYFVCQTEAKKFDSQD